MERACSEEDLDLRRGPWMVEEDHTLMNYIADHGDGRWNSLARCAGLKRTGKSCRLRWLNYLRPDVRHGNITAEEQLLILELHSRWGNRWSKIAQQLPGRTDNEIKNYWRTRVQKHAKQLQCEVNSKQFKDVMRYLWIPRLLERIQAASTTTTTSSCSSTAANPYIPDHPNTMAELDADIYGMAGLSSDSSVVASGGLVGGYNSQVGDLEELLQSEQFSEWLPSPCGLHQQGSLGFQQSPCGLHQQGSLGFQQGPWGESIFIESINENTWSVDNIWSMHEQFQ